MQYANKDIVSFLDADLAADTKDEAEQRGAAAMLANVAGCPALIWKANLHHFPDLFL